MGKISLDVLIADVSLYNSKQHLLEVQNLIPMEEAFFELNNIFLDICDYIESGHIVKDYAFAHIAFRHDPRYFSGVEDHPYIHLIDDLRERGIPVFAHTNYDNLPKIEGVVFYNKIKHETQQRIADQMLNLIIEVIS